MSHCHSRPRPTSGMRALLELLHDSNELGDSRIGLRESPLLRALSWLRTLMAGALGEITVPLDPNDALFAFAVLAMLAALVAYAWTTR
jgi:hypothetical protein